jgi:hypothetical protein
MLALARLFRLSFSMCVPPIKSQLMGLFHNKEKWLATLGRNTRGIWFVRAPTALLLLLLFSSCLKVKIKIYET